MHARALAVALALLLAGGAVGCTWLIGVSDDPVVVDGPTDNGADAGDEDAAPE